MKLSQLLLQREAMLRQARLANLAFAYWHLEQLVTRIDAAGLCGRVRLQTADSTAERYWPVLTALEGSQSVIEEHFTDENVVELADIVGFITGDNDVEATFRLEDMGAKFLQPLQRGLTRAGIDLEPPALRSVRPRRNERTT